MLLIKVNYIWEIISYLIFYGCSKINALSVGTAWADIHHDKTTLQHLPKARETWGKYINVDSAGARHQLIWGSLSVNISLLLIVVLCLCVISKLRTTVSSYIEDNLSSFFSIMLINDNVIFLKVAILTMISWDNCD